MNPVKNFGKICVLKINNSEIFFVRFQIPKGKNLVGVHDIFTATNKSICGETSLKPGGDYLVGGRDTF